MEKQTCMEVSGTLTYPAVQNENSVGVLGLLRGPATTMRVP